MPLVVRPIVVVEVAGPLITNVEKSNLGWKKVAVSSLNSSN